MGVDGSSPGRDPRRRSVRGLLLAIAGAGGGACLLACNALFGIDGLRYDPPGRGPGGGSGGSAASGGSAGSTTASGGGGAGGAGGTAVVLDYAYRRRISLAAEADAPADYSVRVTLDHAALVAEGKALASGDDLRVARELGGGWHEIDRVLDVDSTWAASDTTVWFATEEPLAASSVDESYALLYGHPDAALPPASPAAVFLVYDSFDDGALGSPWTVSTIGGSTGTAVEQDGRLRLSGAGTIWGTADRLVYVHAPVVGGFAADSYAVGRSGTPGTWTTLGGIMVRQSTAPGSRHQLIGPVDTMLSSVDVASAWRLADGASTDGDSHSEGTPVPVWVRLERLGDAVTPTYSYDGASWEACETHPFTDSLVDPVEVGVPFATAGTAVAEVDWIRIRRLVAPEPAATLLDEELLAR